MILITEPVSIIGPKQSNFRPTTFSPAPLATTMPETYEEIEKRISEAIAKFDSP